MARDDTDDGGGWLTYRYRLGGDAGAHAAGTIKAPSFLDAARRLVAGRLADRVGARPVYLRLRAAGEEEVLLEIARPAGDPAARPTLTVVPSDRFAYGEDGG